MSGKVIKAILKPFECEPFPGIVTLVKPRQDLNDIEDPNIVKVVFDNMNRALYFSRSPIPYPNGGLKEWYQHIGIYAFSKYAIDCISKNNVSPLADAENLEQLQWLETCTSISVAITEETLIPVDVPADVRKVVKYLRSVGEN